MKLLFSIFVISEITKSNFRIKDIIFHIFYMILLHEILLKSKLSRRMRKFEEKIQIDVHFKVYA